MSWGYFLDLELTLPTADWDALQRTTAIDLSPQWWGFEEEELEHTFGNAGFESTMFQKVFAWWKDGASCVKKVIETDDRTAVRLILHLDKSGDTQVAGVIAALFEAASKVGGAGYVRLVNDGSYSGEDGVEVRIDDGRLVRSRIDGSNEIADELGAQVYPGMAEEIEKYLSPEALAAIEKPAAKQAVAKKPAAKKQPAAKQPAAKPATKKATKKPAAKKPAATKATKTKATKTKATKTKATKTKAAKTKPAAKSKQKR